MNKLSDPMTNETGKLMKNNHDHTKKPGNEMPVGFLTELHTVLGSIKVNDLGGKYVTALDTVVQTNHHKFQCGDTVSITTIDSRLWVRIWYCIMRKKLPLITSKSIISNVTEDTFTYQLSDTNTE